MAQPCPSRTSARRVGERAGRACLAAMLCLRFFLSGTAMAFLRPGLGALFFTTKSSGEQESGHRAEHAGRFFGDQDQARLMAHGTNVLGNRDCATEYADPARLMVHGTITPRDSQRRDGKRDSWNGKTPDPPCPQEHRRISNCRLDDRP